MLFLPFNMSQVWSTTWVSELLVTRCICSKGSNAGLNNPGQNILNCGAQSIAQTINYYCTQNCMPWQILMLFMRKPPAHFTTISVCVRR